MFRRSVHSLQPDSLCFRPALRKKEQETQYALDNVCDLVCFMAAGNGRCLYGWWIHPHSVGPSRHHSSYQVLPKPEDRLLTAEPEPNPWRDLRHPHKGFGETKLPQPQF
jgi:hypothetical protein